MKICLKISLMLMTLVVLFTTKVPVVHAGCGGGVSGFTTFLSSMVELEDFTVYWNDVFFKNPCQLSDILDVDERLDTIAESLRQSFYSSAPDLSVSSSDLVDDGSEEEEESSSCDMDALQLEYKVTKAELYFVRNANFIDANALSGVESQTVINNIVETYLYDSFYDKMKTRYVTEKGWFSEPDFDIYFAGWITKYEDNIPTYVICDSTWQPLVDKWNEIWETYESAKTAREKEKEKKAEEKAAEKAKKELGAKDAPAGGAKAFFAKHIGFESSGLKEVGEFLTTNEFADDEDSSSSNTSSNTDMASIYQSYTDLLAAYDTDETEAQLLANYKVLYGEGGSEIASSFVDLITDLNDTLKDTITILTTEVNKKAHKVAKKQCGG